MNLKRQLREFLKRFFLFLFIFTLISSLFISLVFQIQLNPINDSIDKEDPNLENKETIYQGIGGEYQQIRKYDNTGDFLGWGLSAGNINDYALDRDYLWIQFARDIWGEFTRFFPAISTNTIDRMYFSMRKTNYLWVGGYAGYSDGSQELVWYKDWSYYYLFSFNVTFSPNKFLVNFTIKGIAQSPALAAPFSLYTEIYYGYTPRIENWSKLKNIVDILESHIFSTHEIAGTQQMSKVYVRFQYYSTGNVNLVELDQDWTSTDFFFVEYEFIRIGIYYYSYLSINSWGIITESPSYYVNVMEDPFPRDSYLSLFSSIDGFPLDSKDFKIFLGTDDQRELINFRTFRGDWYPLYATNPINARFIDDYIEFTTFENGLKSKFERNWIYDSDYYDTLLFQVKVSNPLWLILIYNPEYHEKDYYLEFTEEMVDLWFDISIPVYNFTTYRYITEENLYELGFYITNGTVKLGNIRLGDHSNSEYYIEDISFESWHNTTNQIIPTDRPIWDNHSDYLYDFTNVTNTQGFNIQSQSFTNNFTNPNVIWDNFTAQLDPKYDLTSEKVNVSEIQSYSPSYKDIPQNISKIDDFQYTGIIDSSIWTIQGGSAGNFYSENGKMIVNESSTDYMNETNRNYPISLGIKNLHYYHFGISSLDYKFRIGFYEASSKYIIIEFGYNSFECIVRNTQTTSSIFSFQNDSRDDFSITWDSNKVEFWQNQTKLTTITTNIPQGLKYIWLLSDNKISDNAKYLIDEIYLFNQSKSWNISEEIILNFPFINQSFINSMDLDFSIDLKNESGFPYQPNYPNTFDWELIGARRNWGENDISLIDRIKIKNEKPWWIYLWQFAMSDESGINYITNGTHQNATFYFNNIQAKDKLESFRLNFQAFFGNGTSNMIDYDFGEVLIYDWINNRFDSIYIQDFWDEGFQDIEIWFDKTQIQKYVENNGTLKLRFYSGYQTNYYGIDPFITYYNSSSILIDYLAIDNFAYNEDNFKLALFDYDLASWDEIDKPSSFFNHSLELKYFNGTESKIRYNFSLGINEFYSYQTNITIQIDYWIYENVTYIFNYDLNDSFQYVYLAFDTNYSSESNTGLTFEYRASSFPNYNGSTFKNGLIPIPYPDRRNFNRYIQFRINLTTNYRFNTTYLYGINLSFKYENRTYYIDYSINLNYSIVDPDNIIRIYAKDNGYMRAFRGILDSGLNVFSGYYWSTWTLNPASYWSLGNHTSGFAYLDYNYSEFEPIMRADILLLQIKAGWSQQNLEKGFVEIYDFGASKWKRLGESRYNTPAGNLVDLDLTMELPNASTYINESNRIVRLRFYSGIGSIGQVRFQIHGALITPKIKNNLFMLYNYSSENYDSYDYSRFFNTGDLYYKKISGIWTTFKIIKDEYFNLTTIKVRLYLSSHYDFYHLTHFEFHMDYITYFNTSYKFYYDLGSYTYLFYENISLNFTQMDKTNLSIGWKTSKDNITYSELNKSLEINNFGDQFLLIEVNMTTFVSFNSTYLYSINITYWIENIEFYIWEVNHSLNVTFGYNESYRILGFNLTKLIGNIEFYTIGEFKVWVYDFDLDSYVQLVFGNLSQFDIPIPYYANHSFGLKFFCNSSFEYQFSYKIEIQRFYNETWNLTRYTPNGYRLINPENRQDPNKLVFSAQLITIAILDYFDNVLLRKEINWSSFTDLALPICTFIFENKGNETILIDIVRGLGTDIQIPIPSDSSISLRIFSTSYKLEVRNLQLRLLNITNFSPNRSRTYYMSYGEKREIEIPEFDFWDEITSFLFGTPLGITLFIIIIVVLAIIFIDFVYNIRAWRNNRKREKRSQRRSDLEKYRKGFGGADI